MSDDSGLLENIVEDVEQYAEQRASGVSFENATAARELRTALRRNDVDVDEVRYIGEDPSVMYYHDSETHIEDVVSIAVVAAKARQVVPSVLSATALESENSRCGNFMVKREWLDAYSDGELSEKELAKRALATWEEL